MTNTAEKIAKLPISGERIKKAKPQLICSKDGSPKRNLANVLTVMTSHPDWEGVLAYDEFGQCVVARTAPPMRDSERPYGYTPGDWTDEDTTRTAAWFASEIGFEPTQTHVDQAVMTVAKKSAFHPVRDWLSSLTWDGTGRIDGLLSDYFGAMKSSYTEAVGRCWMISAAARAFEPGCKVDTMLILEGQQGIGKSSLLRDLAGREWFADSGLELQNKDSYQNLRRKFVYEFGELSAFKGRDIERIKNFLSSQVDTYRPSYGRRSIDHPRQCVFVGTTNLEHYLHDPTGGRRFWPVKCGKLDFAALNRDREQIWAEATARYLDGEIWYLQGDELRGAAAEEQAQREQEQAWLPLVASWLEDATVPNTDDEGRRRVRIEDGFTTSDVLMGAIGFSADKIQQRHTIECGTILKKLGFFSRQERVSGTKDARVRKYYRDDCDDRDDHCDDATQAN